MVTVKSPASDLIWNASLIGKPIHVSRLRAFCAGPADVAVKVRTADNLGVKVKGGLRHDEQQELLKLRGGHRALKGVL